MLFVRTWNVFHGKTETPVRGNNLAEMVRLATADRPDVVCLQEVPLWALRRLGEWSGYRAFPAIGRRPPLGVLARTEPLADFVSDRTSPNSRSARLLRIGFGGPGNATLVASHVNVVEQRRFVLNPAATRRRDAARLQLGWFERAKWARELKACIGVRLVLPDQREAVVVNIHTTAYPEAVATIEFERAVEFANRFADAGQVLVLAGDFNLRAAADPIRTLVERSGFSGPGPGVDHVLVRGAAATAPQTWPNDRRSLHGRMLSDHAPVDVTVS